MNRERRGWGVACIDASVCCLLAWLIAAPAGWPTGRPQALPPRARCESCRRASPAAATQALSCGKTSPPSLRLRSAAPNPPQQQARHPDARRLHPYPAYSRARCPAADMAGKPGLPPERLRCSAQPHNTLLAGRAHITTAPPGASGSNSGGNMAEEYRRRPARARPAQARCAMGAATPVRRYLQVRDLTATTSCTLKKLATSRAGGEAMTVSHSPREATGDVAFVQTSWPGVWRKAIRPRRFIEPQATAPPTPRSMDCSRPRPRSATPGVMPPPPPSTTPS